ncbi:MAG: DUF86 domain-containing protein [Candidatus Lokiarchaeota archaeon]|nr:DUF86 domain-containing protein [Candidatus Lokiarchaeota archaeon]
MKKNELFFLINIKDSIELIENYVQNKSKEEFLNINILQDSIIRRLEIIGEAVKNINENIKIKYPDIQWKKISGMRDILIHQYFGVDLELTWEVIKKDIPTLKKQILDIIDIIKIE